MEGHAMTFEEALEKHGRFLFTSQGYSMWPLITPGRDLVEISRRPAGRLKRFDVALYKRGGQYILHRILRVEPESYTIAGDNNRRLERDIRDEQIIGVLTGLVRKGRRLTLDEPGYRLYVRLWCGCFPLRAALLYVLALLRGAYGALRRRLRRRTDSED